jgi:hypothetical protein
MIKALILLSVSIVTAFCVYTIYSILTSKQLMRKDNDMEKETQRSLWISGLLIIANALGLAYLLNPRKFDEKTEEIKQSIKKIFKSGKL